jgi:hypothetical protein
MLAAKSSRGVGAMKGTRRLGQEAASDGGRGRSWPAGGPAGIGVAALLAALVTAAVAVAAPVRNGTYRGLTARGANVTFKVSANGKKVLGFTTILGYDGKCGQGGGPAWTVKVSSMALKSNGGFSGTGSGTLSVLKPVTIKVAGRIKGRNASGTVEEPAAFHCQTGPNKGANAYATTFTAKAK